MSIIVAATPRIIEGRHTKTGAPIVTVQLAQKVGSDTFKRLGTEARKLGGYYSSYRGNGAIPGFIFKDRASAERFAALARGDDLQPSDRQQPARAHRQWGGTAGTASPPSAVAPQHMQLQVGMGRFLPGPAAPQPAPMPGLGAPMAAGGIVARAHRQEGGAAEDAPWFERSEARELYDAPRSLFGHLPALPQSPAGTAPAALQPGRIEMSPITPWMLKYIPLSGLAASAGPYGAPLPRIEHLGKGPPDAPKLPAGAIEQASFDPERTLSEIGTLEKTPAFGGSGES